MARRGSTKFAQGIYTPVNTQKYIGKGKITYRSSWELKFCQFLDNNENILEWNSEGIRIPYRHPITGKNTTYVPDFLVRYRNKHNQVKTELIEIKPSNQSAIMEGQNSNQRAVVAVNHHKWASARAWCKAQGITFRVLTEKDIFSQTGKK